MGRGNYARFFGGFCATDHPSVGEGGDSHARYFLGGLPTLPFCPPPCGQGKLCFFLELFAHSESLSSPAVRPLGHPVDKNRLAHRLLSVTIDYDMQRQTHF